MKKKKKILLTVSILVFIAAVICAGIADNQYLQEKNAGNEYEKIREEAGSGIPEENTEPEVPEKDPVEIPIDFDKLQERNPDVYAWITIPNTDIDYPVLQSGTDNTYYLTHTIDRTENPEGSIFTENYNGKDFEDPNTVIYGHNMKNGSMFEDLLNYRDRSFFDENREVLIYTPDAIRHYRIFASYLYDDRHLLQSFDYDNTFIYEQYLSMVLSIRDMNSCIDTEAEIGKDDKIITLSTCYGTQTHSRYLVQAVLVSIEK